MSSKVAASSRTRTVKQPGVGLSSTSKLQKNSTQGLKTGQQQQKQNSLLTQTLKDTILNDADAAKVMTDDIDNIISLQISPTVIANYQFNNYAAMRRLLSYGSDIATVEGAQKQSPSNSAGTTDLPAGSESDDAGQTKLEPVISTDLSLRKKIRQKVIKDLQKDGQETDETAAVEEQGGTQTTIQPERDSPPADEAYADDTNDAQPPTANTNARPKASRAHQTRKQSAVPSTITSSPASTTGSKSPFAELFADPDRQVTRSNFSPFSSKFVPSEHKSRPGANASTQPSEADILNALMNDGASESDDDGDDLFIDDDEANGAAAKAAQRQAQRKKQQRRLGKTLVERTFEAAAAKEENARNTKSQAAALLATSNANQFNTAAPTEQQSVQLYKSPIRQQMEDVLMGTSVVDNGGDTVKERSFGATATRAEGEGEGELGMTGMSQTSPGGHRRYTHPMYVTRTFEPSNERAVDKLDNEEEVEDAELQKYTHLGIASPATSVTEFHRFMVKTKMESDASGEKAAAEKRQKDKAILKRFNEKQVSGMKYTRQIPVSGSFVMEVRKPSMQNSGNAAPSPEGQPS